MQKSENWHWHVPTAEPKKSRAAKGHDATEFGHPREARQGSPCFHRGAEANARNRLMFPEFQFQFQCIAASLVTVKITGPWRTIPHADDSNVRNRGSPGWVLSAG